MQSTTFPWPHVGMAVLAAAASVGDLNAASLEGRVLDPQGAAVANAQLRLSNRNSGALRQTRSRADGSYTFAAVPVGAYLLEGEASDAALAGSRDATIRGAETQDLILELTGTTVEVVVTASSTPLAVQEAAKALDATDAKQIALRNEFALSEVIRNVPGVRVRQLRGPGSFVSIQTRGLRNHDTAVLIDGMRFRDAAASQGDATGFFSAMNVVDTERVEFLRGSGSSLYGSHAVGGVMNIRSHQGGGRPHGELRTEGGGLGMLRGVGRFAGGLGGDRFVYSGGVSHLNISRGHRDASPHRNTSAQGFAKYSLAPHLSLSGRIWGAGAYLALAESPAFPEAVTANFPASGPVPAVALPEAELGRFERGLPYTVGASTFVPDQADPDGSLASDFLVAAFALRHQVTPFSSYRVAYQRTATRRGYRDGPAGPGMFEPALSNESRFHGETHTLQMRTDQRAGGANLLSLGYEGEREAYVGSNTDDGSAPPESWVEFDQVSHAAFAQDQIQLLDGSLQVSLAGRAQYFTLGSPVFSGSRSPFEGALSQAPRGALTSDAAVAYFVRSSGTKLRAHAGNSFRAPSAYERFGASYSGFSGSFSYWGDPRLEPERSQAFDAGVDQWLHGSRLRVSGTFFYTDLPQTIIFDFANFPADDAFGRFGGYRNAGGGIARGAELSARLAPAAGTAVQAAYTYTNSDSRSPTVGADYFEIPGLSKHVVSATATQWFGKRVNLTFDLFAVSDYAWSPYGAQGRLLTLAGPVKTDLVLRYDMPIAEGKRLELYGKAENAFDNDYYENGFGSPGVWVIGGLRLEF